MIMKTRPYCQNAQLTARMLRQEYRAHRLAKDVRGRLFEFISYPWASQDGRDVLIKVRVPGDPTSIETKSVFDLNTEGQDCLCDVAGEFYMKPEYYAMRDAEREEQHDDTWRIQ